MIDHSQKKQLVFSSLVASGVALTLLFNNCAESSHDSLSSFEVDQQAVLACESRLETVYAQSFYPFLSSSCNNCHVNGPGKGSFADSDVARSHNAFRAAGLEKVSSFAVSASHQPPFTGVQNQAIVDSAKAQYESAQASFENCIAQAGASGSANAGLKPLMTRDVSLDLDAGGGRTLSWDLSADLEDSSEEGVPATFRMDVRLRLRDGVPIGYEFSNPQLVTRDATIKIDGIHFYFNGVLDSSATTYLNVYETVGPDRTSPLAGSSSVNLVVRDVEVTDRLSIYFKSIQVVATTDSELQQPGFVGFRELIASGGTLQRNCLSCHNSGNALGGLNLEDYNQVMSQNYVVANDHRASLLWQRMVDGQNPMPPSGVIPNAANDIAAWIDEGAVERGRTTISSQTGQQPNQISDLKLWIRADTGITFAEGNRILVWNDLSDSDSAFTQSASNRQPRVVVEPTAFGGRAVVYCDGSDALMGPTSNTVTGDNADELTMVMALQIEGGRSGYVLNLHRSGGADILMSLLVNRNESNQESAGFLGFNLRRTNNNVAFLMNNNQGNGHISTSPRIVIARVDSTASTPRNTLRINGQVVRSDSTASLQPRTGNNFPVSLCSHNGSNHFFRGAIAEAAIYRRAISDQEVEQLEAYLSSRYQIPLE